jgi:hypothetical protein
MAALTPTPPKAVKCLLCPKVNLLIAQKVDQASAFFVYWCPYCGGGQLLLCDGAPSHKGRWFEFTESRYGDGWVFGTRYRWEERHGWVNVTTFPGCDVPVVGLHQFLDELKKAEKLP